MDCYSLEALPYLKGVEYAFREFFCGVKVMKVIKKINNNVAECVDSKGNHLIAFGKGIGFPKTPYELADLSQITMTFYKLNKHFELLLNEISEEIMDVSTEIVVMAQKELNEQLNPTLVFSLADHIQFAIQRLSTYKDAKLNYSHEMEQLYPKETHLATEAVKIIQRKLLVSLPKSEITSITIHFLNSQEEYKMTQEELAIDETIEQITSLVEDELDIAIDRQEFNYNRFQMHMLYYFKRVRNDGQFITKSNHLLDSIKKEHQQIFEIAVKVAVLIKERLRIKTSNDELLYLMIHINRLYEKNMEG